jgi:hypothetical protein
VSYKKHITEVCSSKANTSETCDLSLFLYVQNHLDSASFDCQEFPGLVVSNDLPHVFVYTRASLSQTHHISFTDEVSSCYAVRRELTFAKPIFTHSCIYFYMSFFSGCILTP